MNNSLSRSLLRLLACWPALLLATSALAQGDAPSLRAADFIVAVVNSEPVTNSEVGAMRKRLLSELRARGEPIPEAAQLNQQALEWLINEKAQLQLAQETGVRIDAEQLAQAEANIAARNQLTPEAFAQRLLQEGTNLAEFRQQLKYPPIARIALLTLKGRNEDKVKLSAEHVRAEIEKHTGELRDLVLNGPAPAPLARAETFYRYQLMLRTRQMTKLGEFIISNPSAMVQRAEIGRAHV